MLALGDVGAGPDELEHFTLVIINRAPAVSPINIGTVLAPDPVLFGEAAAGPRGLHVSAQHAFVIIRMQTLVPRPQRPWELAVLVTQGFVDLAEPVDQGGVGVND